MRNRLQAQSIGEYAVLLAIIASAIIAMQVYAQRALQARYHQAVAQVGRDLRDTLGNDELPLQYEPYYQVSEINRADAQNLESQTLSGGSRQATISEESQRKGWQYTGADVD